MEKVLLNGSVKTVGRLSAQSVLEILKMGSIALIATRNRKIAGQIQI